jgi:serine protease Do
MRLSRLLPLLSTLTVFAPAQQPDAAAAPAAPGAATAARSSARQHAATLAAAFAEVAQQVAPSVVTIRAFVRDAAGADRRAGDRGIGWTEAIENETYPGYRLHAACSGFVVDADGSVLTCFRPLQRSDGALPDLVDVETHDNRRILAEIVGSEPVVDLAIVHCMVYPEGRKTPLPALEFGDSDAIETGQWAFGVGDPAGPERFFAPGTFVARPCRDCYQDYLNSFYQQVAMVAHPQAYGGPIVDLDGRVVGILAPRRQPSGSLVDLRFGIEFGLPSKIVTGLYESIRQVRSFQSPWLGFSVMSRAEIATTRGIEAFHAMQKPRNGILIENVFRPSPAADAGILPGDFLAAFDGTRIFTPVDFQKCLYLAGVGRTVKLEMFRAGETFHRELTVQVRPPEAVPR